MELIPVITLALVAVLLVLVIILLARKPVQPPKTTDSGAISALGALVTQNLREGREAQDSRLAAMDRSVSGQLDPLKNACTAFRSKLRSSSTASAPPWTAICASCARTTTKSWTKCAALWTKSCKKHCPTA